MVSIRDSIELKFSEIKYMKQFRIKNRAWAEPFAWIAAGSVLGVVLLPIAAIEDGKEGVKTWLRFEAFLIAVAAPPLYVVSRKRKFDFEKGLA